MNGHLTIVRGHPGSGKTTWARAEAIRTNARHVEADQWRQPEGGVYLWSEETNRYAHNWAALEALRWLRQGVPVIVTATFTTHAEIHRLESLCGKAQRIVRMTAHYTNIHKVPAEWVKRCIDNYEPLPGEESLCPNGHSERDKHSYSLLSESDQA